MTVLQAGPGRLERRKARTRAAIIEAASGLFHERGYEETSIQNIAERADTGVGTLYGYFPSKEDILREVLVAARDEALQEYFSAIDEQTPAIDRVCRAIDTTSSYLRDHRAILVAVFQISTRNRLVDEAQADWLYRAFHELVLLGLERGEFRQVPSDAATRLLITMVTTACLGIGAWKGREDDPALVGELHTLARALLLKA